MSPVNRYRTAFVAACAALVISWGITVAVASTPTATAAPACNTDALCTAQSILAGCKAGLVTPPPIGTAQRIRLQTCVDDYTKRIIPALMRQTPAPSPSASATPSSSPSASATPTPTATTTAPSPTPTATTPTPSPTPSDLGFPGPDNTGPRGATLLPWTLPNGQPGCPADGSPAAITTPNLHLSQVLINCDVRVLTSGLVITFSKINGSINDEETDTRSFTINDSEIDGGINHNAAVWHTNLTALRDNIHGGITAVSCVDTCHVEDSWLHGQRHDPSTTGQHFGGFLSNGGGDVNHQSLIKHNTIVCDADEVDPVPSDPNQISSCSGDVNLFGDFGGVHYYTFDNNFLGAGTATGHPSLCAYGGNSDVASGNKQPGDNIHYTDNVFERGPFGTCGVFGPVGDIDMTRPGMVWTNNRYEDGEVINP